MNFISREYLTDAEDYRIAVRGLYETIRATHQYLELTLSPAAFRYYHDGDFTDILLAVQEELDKLPELHIVLLIDLLRNAGPDKCWQLVEEAICWSRNGALRVVGVNLGGDEVRFPTALFTRHLQAACANGLHVTAHAGEWGSVDDVWQAIEAAQNASVMAFAPPTIRC